MSRKNKRPQVSPELFLETLNDNEEDMGEGAAYLVTCEQLGVDPADGYDLMAQHPTARDVTPDPLDDVLTGEFQFTNIGRNKVSFKTALTGQKSLFAAIKPHLMSNDIEFEYDSETRSGKIFVGIVREVGAFQRV